MSKGSAVKKESASKKDSVRKSIARNRKALHEYHIEETFEAGLVLTGTEVKSLREGRANLTDGFGLIFQGEAWLEHAYIPEYTQGTWTNHSARRRRKMLLHKSEILRITQGAANLIREGKTPSLVSVIQTSASGGMIPLERSLRDLVRAGIVSESVAAAVLGDLPDAPLPG